MSAGDSLSTTYEKIDSLSLELRELVSDIAQRQKSPDDLLLLEQADLSALFIEKKKSEGITNGDLEMQTDISESTLKRAIKDPNRASLQNILAIARELGVKIWIEK